ncbi:MAG: DUF4124 domain-containing protein [Gammaproteobacteria bacterium]|jgi:hypothetical protein
MPSKALAAALLLPLVLPGVAAAKFYRWVDANGNVHISDTLPPEAAHDYKVEVMDSAGDVETTVGPAPTKAELEKRAQQKKAKEQASVDAEKQRRLDQILLQTFTTVEDLERARDDRLGLVDTNIKIAQEKVTSIKSQLGSVEARLKKHPDNQNLNEQVMNLKNALADNEDYLHQQQQVRGDIVKKFKHDIARFKELKAEQAKEKQAKQQQQQQQ